MNNLVFLLLAFVAIVPGYTSEKLKFVEGLYVKNHSCGANSGEEQQGKNLSEFSKLKIKAKTASIAEISLETVVLINQSGLGIQPYSCSFNGVAELKGKKLKILKDDEGYEVNVTCLGIFGPRQI
ncbi:hypothetical protein RY831_33010 [Noviherbaspirillum sp. CPCC 100848]|uniref:Uncharacterized protein n=1 Tax=Noviherbaspirillum album TaxID=3080276 RepID=A0ABU6JJQ3_9BURK|nr:hypothetical protein [Noviherbaspirillum sp. CPCC 100848]MEC4723922.1 hypothetical protein [Noviherbaspirillum sp. CPCC 100848]